MQPQYEMANTLYHQITLHPSTLSPNHSGHLHHNPPRQFHQHQFQFQASQQPHPDSTTTVSFWNSINTMLSNANGKKQEVNEYFGELEGVYKKGSSSFVNNEGTNGVDGAVRRRKGRKRMRKTKVEEEMGLMGSFFKRLVKHVIKQQEVLQNKLLEAIDRIEKERVEWEEGWRRQEMEIQDREAIVRARERDLASRRQSPIVSSIEKITGQRFGLVSGTSRHQ